MHLYIISAENDSLKTAGCTLNLSVGFDKLSSQNVGPVNAPLSNDACALLPHFDASITDSLQKLTSPSPGLVGTCQCYCLAHDLLS